jgi:hypothetical protein
VRERLGRHGAGICQVQSLADCSISQKKKSTSSRPPATPELSPGTAPDLGSCCASYFDGAKKVEKKAERRCHTPASWLLCSLSPPRASDAPFPAMHCTNMRILVNTYAPDCPRTVTPAPSLLGPVLCCSALAFPLVLPFAPPLLLSQPELCVFSLQRLVLGDGLFDFC